MAPIETKDYCSDHSMCMEKFHGLETWRDRIGETVQEQSEEIVKLRIFRAQIIALSVAAQVIGSGAMTLILHFVGR